MDLASLDVNLLIALDVLLQERSVSRAARRLALSQPATSRILGKLRDAFGDELLVREGREMVPTPRASRLASPLRQALASLRNVIAEGGAFDPATTNRRFVLSTHNQAQATTLPQAWRRFRDAAPLAELVLQPYDPGFERWLEDGSVDLVAASRRSGVAWVHSEPLLEETWCCVVGPGFEHREPLSLDAFLEADHVMVSPRGEGQGVVDAVLAQRDLTRKVAVRVPDFVGGLIFVAQSSTIMTVPRSLAEIAESLLPLRIVAPPVELGTTVIYLSWHQRLNDDEAHRWFRQLIFDSVRREPRHGDELTTVDPPAGSVE